MNGPSAGAFIVLVVFGSLAFITWTLMHYRSRRGVTPPELAAIEQRLARIEQAVDAIAVETERISEGQRFTTKLLSERASAREGV